MTTKISTANLDSSITTLIGSGGGPKVTAITYPGNDLAADPAGGQTITLTGTGFVSGCSVFVGTTQASVVTFISATSVTFTSPTLAAATYTLYLVNPDGGTATIVPGISYSGTPTWSTTAGTLGSVYEYSPISNATTATGDGSIAYSVFSGTLPTGSSLNTSTGVITGTSPASAGATTYTFVIRATDAQLQDTDRTFSITINTDAVTWTTPAANSTVTLGQGLASTSTLLATSAAGNAITYTANALPTGLSISGATVTGTPTVVGNTTSTFTATAATTNRTATAIINWTVSVSGDTYFPYTTLLLSGAVATETFVADASTNNFAVNIVGDTKPNNFNPYTPGYYSNYFNGSSNFTSSTSQIVPTGSFTVECWVYVTSTANQGFVGQGTNANAARFSIAIDSGLWWTQIGNASINTGTPIINTWNYLAVTFNGSTLTLYVNGTSVGTVATSTSAQNTTLTIGTLSPSWAAGYFVTGYISNVRVSSVVRTIVTPTAPYTSDASTRLLTCQSNRFLDNSANAFALTITGTPSVQSSTPFVPNTQYAAYGSTYFDGTGDYLSVPSNTAFQFGTGNFTVEYWVNFTTTPGASSIIPLSCWSSNSGWELYYKGSPGTAFTWYYNSNALVGTTLPKPNTWYHLAVTRSSGTTRLFVNGAIEATLNSDTTNFTPSSALYIGNESGSNTPLTGYLTDVRVVKGTAVYTSAFTPPSAPLTAVTNTGLLTCQTNQPANNSVFLDSSTNAFAVTRAGNTSAGTFTPYGANWSNYFNGSSGKVSIPYNANYVLGTNDFTVEFWVMFNDISANTRGLVSLGYGSNGDGPITSTWALYYLGSEGSSQLRFYRYNGSTETYYTTSGFSPSNGVWYHIAVSRTGGNLRIFGNGVALYSGANSINYTAINTSDPLLVGLGYFGPQLGMNGPRYFNGYISNLRVINGTGIYSSGFTPPTAPLTAVTNTKLLACQSNRYVDNSSIGATVTPGGNTTIQRFSPFSPSAAYTAGTISGSAYFDGTGDYLTTPSSSLFNLNGINWTVEGWFNLVSATSDDRLFVFAGASVSWGFYRRAATGNIYFGQMGSDEALLGNMLLNEWTHLALVRTSGPTISLYKNGVFSASTAAYSMPNENCTFLIAGNPAPYANTVTKGYVSDVRVVKGTALYTTTFTPPTAPLTAVTNTSLLLNMTSAGIVDATMINSLETVGDAKRVATQTPYAGSYYSNYFDGTGDYLTTAINAAFAFGTGDFTMECWFSTTTLGVSQKLITFYPVGSLSGYNAIFIDVGNTVSYGANGEANITSSGTITINTWYHLAAVRLSGTTKLYLNGTQVGSNYTDSTSYLTSRPAIGTDGYSLNTSNFYGYISNLRVVKGVGVYTGTFTPPTAPLTATQVAGTNIAAVTGTATSLLTCQSNSLVDNSANAFAVTRTGDTSVQSFNPFQRNSAATMYFDGTTDALFEPSNLSYGYGTGDFTIEVWLYLNATTTQTIVSNLTASNGASVAPHIYYANASGIRYYVNSTDRITGSALSTGTWYHIAVSRSGSSTKMFINGTQTGSTYTDTNNYGTSNPLGVGDYAVPLTGVVTLNGYINDLRITKGTARYTATFTPPTTAFIAK